MNKQQFGLKYSRYALENFVLLDAERTYHASSAHFKVILIFSKTNTIM